MEEASIVAPVQQVVDPNDPLTLEQAEQRLNALLSQAEKNAWDVGDLLNKIERRGLARAGFGKTKSWITQRVPAAEGKTSTLYRYANVAATYTKDEADKWGMARLDCLISHDLQSLGQPVAGDPADREIQLVQTDGSVIAKKFSECTCQELRISVQAQKKAKGKAGQTKDAKLGDSPRKGLAPEKQGEVHPLRYGLAILVLGQLVVGISYLLPDWLPGSWPAIIGGMLSLAGVGMLLPHWKQAQAAILEAIRRGGGMHILRTQARRWFQAVLRVVAAVGSRLRARGSRTPKLPAPPGATPEEPTPPIKKAA